jgi:uncharacterized protein
MEEKTKKIIIDYVKNELSFDSSGHGVDHAIRTCHNAELILRDEKGNEKIVLTAALLHDTADKKLFKDIAFQISKMRLFLSELNYTSDEIEKIIYIVSSISYNEGNYVKLHDIDAEIVRDSDRLEAIGAIGIIRAIQYGDFKGRRFYSDDNIYISGNKKTFNKSSNTTLSHFYEKLLLVKSLMCTETGKKLAKKRHLFLCKFLNEFYSEI